MFVFILINRKNLKMFKWTQEIDLNEVLAHMESCSSLSAATGLFSCDLLHYCPSHMSTPDRFTAVPYSFLTPLCTVNYSVPWKCSCTLRLIATSQYVSDLFGMSLLSSWCSFGKKLTNQLLEHPETGVFHLTSLVTCFPVLACIQSPSC